MVQCLKSTATSNPLVLIDEIDKLGRGNQVQYDPGPLSPHATSVLSTPLLSLFLCPSCLPRPDLLELLLASPPAPPPPPTGCPCLCTAGATANLPPPSSITREIPPLLYSSCWIRSRIRASRITT